MRKSLSDRFGSILVMKNDTEHPKWAIFNLKLKKEARRATTNLVRAKRRHFEIAMSHPTDMYKDTGNAKILVLSRSVQELWSKN